MAAKFEDSEARFVDVTSWEIDLLLEDEVTAVELFAFDADGDLIGSDAIEIATTSTAVVLVAIDPASGPRAGGQEVTLNGLHFAEGLEVSFGSAAAPVVRVLSDREAIATTPLAETGLDVSGVVDVSVVLDGERSTLVDAYMYDPPVPFLRADANTDGRVNVSDAIRILTYLFAGGVDLSCLKTADVDADSGVNISDPILLLNYLFSDGAPLAEPRGECGVESRETTVSCVSYRPCTS